MNAARYAADTSVVIAAVSTHSPFFQRARAALKQAPDPIAHVVAEAYSVLTRLPHDLRVEPHSAARIVARALPGELLSLPVDLAVRLPELLADADISGGAVYDAIVGLTALNNGRVLFSCDRRAAATYQVLGITVQFV